MTRQSVESSEYTSEQFQRLLADNGITCSMSRAGNVRDNSATENFFSSLKTERPPVKSIAPDMKQGPTSSTTSNAFTTRADGIENWDTWAQWSSRLALCGLGCLSAKPAAGQAASLHDANTLLTPPRDRLICQSENNTWTRKNHCNHDIWKEWLF